MAVCDRLSAFSAKSPDPTDIRSIIAFYIRTGIAGNRTVLYFIYITIPADHTGIPVSIYFNIAFYRAVGDFFSGRSLSHNGTDAL